MNKDVIYIDVEDDITAIIGKVKDAQQKIVALVPPKRIGVLQSAVNLRLLARAAEQSNKRLVLISNNSALMALASAAKIPVAKNLQSKPEMAQIAALDVDEGEDVIDGAKLPVGELAKTADSASAGDSVGNAIIDEAVRENAAEKTPKATPPAPGQLPPRPRAKNGPKVPNFNKFRKKMVLIVAGVVLLLGFLVWALFFAPRATVLITARTTDSSMNAQVTLSDQAATKLSTATIKAVTKTMEKDADMTFAATGTKEVGEKSQGQVVFENCETMSSQTIPAGTAITANGQSYVTQAAATVPGGSGGFGGCASPGESDPVNVIASDIGEEYDTASGTRFSVDGHSNNSTLQYFRATATTDVDGGSKREVKVVSETDVQKAIDELADQNGDDIKKELSGQFEDSAVVIEQTFKADRGDVTSSPAVGDEASGGKAKLTGKVVYSLTGVPKEEIGRYLDEYFNKQLEGKDDQRIYSNGTDEASFTGVDAQDNGFNANLVTTAQIGPKINDQEIKEMAKGKRYGDIQSGIEAIPGVEAVDIKFWPFWVSTTPNDISRINVEFKLNESE